MITSSVIEALGWTLLHSLWQASLVALAFYLIRRILYQPTYIYLWAVGSLLLVTGWSLYTFVEVYESEKTYSSTVTLRAAPAIPVPESLSTIGESTPITKSSERFWLETLATWIAPYIKFITMGWLLGMLLLSTRLVGGLWYLLRLKQLHTAPLPAWEATVRTLACRLTLRRSVTLLESRVAKAPMVIGYLKPVILLPAALVTSLPPEQIEAIIAHELAHVHRRDYWVGILQSLVEVIFFYHPAVWWISSVAREEREKCCDDLAVSLGGDPVVYAKALSEAEALQQHTLPPLALAFAQRRSSLLVRVERLVHPPASPTHPAVKLLSLVSMLLLVTYVAISDTFADEAERGEQWLENGFLSPPPRLSPPVASDTLTPEKEMVEEDGWQGSNKARAFIPPVDPDTLPDEDSESMPTTEQHHRNRFSFHTDDSSDFVFDMDFDVDEDVANAADPYVYFHFGDDDEAGWESFRHRQIYLNDTFPTFPWSDSLWLESVGALGEQMGTFSEELKSFLTDSIATNELQERLGSVQRELGHLQAELGSSLQRSFSEERMEAWRGKLDKEQERVQREMERIQRTMKKSQERREEGQRRARERQIEARTREHSRVHRTFDDTVDRLEGELLADNLIRKGKEYRFELKPKGLYINRKKQSDDLLKKYRDVLKVSENTNFSIVRTAE